METCKSRATHTKDKKSKWKETEQLYNNIQYQYCRHNTSEMTTEFCLLEVSEREKRLMPFWFIYAEMHSKKENDKYMQSCHTQIEYCMLKH